MDKKTKQTIIKKHQRDEKDVGSPEVQIGILTQRIQTVNNHLQKAKKDHLSRRGLLQMVGLRKKHLKYLARKDQVAYQKIVKKLKIRDPKSKK